MKLRLVLGGVALALTMTTTAMSAEQAPAAAKPATPAARPPGPPGGFNFGQAGAIQKVAENLYVIPGGGGNSTVFVTSKGVVLVDSKVSGQGQAILDQIKTVTDKPVIYLINTHSHFDHTGSNAFFPEAVEIVTQQNLAADLIKESNPQDAAAKRGLADRTYKDKLTLLSGDEAIDLYNFGAAHTNGDSFVVFRKARVMATGDVFAGKGQPIIDTMHGGSGVAYPEFIAAAVKTIKNVDTVIPGHSPQLKWQDLVDFGEFTQLFLAHARQSLQAGKSPEEAMKSLQLPAKFTGYTLGRTMMTGPGGNFEVIYKELQAK